MSFGALAPVSRGWLLGEVPGDAGQSRACFGFPLNCFARPGTVSQLPVTHQKKTKKDRERD